MDKKTINIEELIFQFSIKTKKYGELFFQKFDESEKIDLLDHILNKNTNEDGIFEEIFENTYIEAERNTKDISEIKLSELTLKEKIDFLKGFFAIQFCDYKYNKELSIKDNITTAKEYEKKFLNEQRKKLSDTMNLNFSALSLIDIDKLTGIRQLNDAIDRFTKPTKILPDSPTELPIIQPPIDAKLEKLNQVENSINDLATTVLELNKITNTTNEIQKTHLETYINNVEQQTIENRKENRITRCISIIAICVPIIFQIFQTTYDIRKTSKTNTHDAILENQKIELLQDIVRNTDFKEDLDKLSKEINMLKKDKEELESEITSLKKQIEDSNKSQKENNGADGT